MADTSMMSDEEFDNYMTNLPEEVVPDVLEDTNTEEESQEVSDTTESDDDDSQETAETEEEESEEESQAEVEEPTEDTEDEDTDTEQSEETSSIDYKAFYEQVTSDYKANGKVMPGIKDPEDFKTALSMASNYALKTTAMKQHMARIKMLKDVNDDELNEMLDFKNRNPEVIQKALKEAGIDPLDIDTDKAITYKAKDYSVSQSEIEFDEVIDSIKDTPEFSRTSEVVTKVWDERSKAQMLSNPALLRGLNEEMAMGRFDVIQGQIDQMKLLGKTGGRSDLELYQEIATELNKQQARVQSEPREVPKPKAKAEDPAIKDAKKKAGISTKTKSNVVKKHDPASLSDEEFLQLMESGAKFI